MLIEPRPLTSWGSALGLMGTWRCHQLSEPQFELYECVGGLFSRSMCFRLVCKTLLPGSATSSPSSGQPSAAEPTPLASSSSSSSQFWLVAEASDMDDILLDWQMLLGAIQHEREVSRLLQFSGSFLLWFCRKQHREQLAALGCRTRKAQQRRDVRTQLDSDAGNLFWDLVRANNLPSRGDAPAKSLRRRTRSQLLPPSKWPARPQSVQAPERDHQQQSLSRSDVLPSPSPSPSPPPPVSSRKRFSRVLFASAPTQAPGTTTCRCGAHVRTKFCTACGAPQQQDHHQAEAAKRTTSAESTSNTPVALPKRPTTPTPSTTPRSASSPNTARPLSPEPAAASVESKARSDDAAPSRSSFFWSWGAAKPEQQLSGLIKKWGGELLLWQELDSSRTLFHVACAQGNVELVSELLEAASSARLLHDVLYARCHLGWTGLFHAAAAGHTAAVQRLLDAGCHSFGLDETGRCPLHVAVRGNHVDTAQLLTGTGYGANVVDRTGRSPLHYAVEVRNEAMVHFLAHAGAEPQPVLDYYRFSAVADDDVELRKMFAVLRGYANMAKAYASFKQQRSVAAIECLESEFADIAFDVSTAPLILSTGEVMPPAPPPPLPPAPPPPLSDEVVAAVVAAAGTAPPASNESSPVPPADVKRVNRLSYVAPQVEPTVDGRHVRAADGYAAESSSSSERFALSVSCDPSPSPSPSPSRSESVSPRSVAFNGASSHCLVPGGIRGGRRCAACHGFIMSLSTLQCSSCGLTWHPSCRQAAMLESVCGGPEHDCETVATLQEQYRDIFSARDLAQLHDRYVRIASAMSAHQQSVAGATAASAFCQAIGCVQGVPAVGAAILAAFAGMDAGQLLLSGFISSLAIALRGTVEQRLSLAFFLMSNGKPMLAKTDVRRFVDGVHAALASVGIGWPADAFFNELVAGLGIEAADSLASLASYIDYAGRSLDYLRSLGTVRECFASSQLHGSIFAAPPDCLSIWIGDGHWELVQAIVVGLRRALGEGDALYAGRSQTAGLKPHHFDAEIAFNQVLPRWSLVDYAPIVFHRIRNLSAIAPREYMLAMGVEQLLGSLLVGEFGTLSSLSSTGRSGSFFMRSRCRQYLIKTLPTRELLLLRSLLPVYFRHLQNEPNSLLCRFYGLHQIAFDESSDDDSTLLRAGRLLSAPIIAPLTSRNFQLPFVVMNNIFGGHAVHEQYDLKGSTVDRTIGERALLEADPNRSRKDLDLTENIHVGPRVKAKILDQLERDTHLLCSNNICDYSLLVGIHRLAQPQPPPPADSPGGANRSLSAWHSNGVLSTDGTCIYFIGVVDILTEYDMQKRGERALKSIRYNSDKISALPPVPYRARFLRYIQRILD